MSGPERTADSHTSELSEYLAHQIRRGFGLVGSVAGSSAPISMAGGFSGSRIYRWVDSLGQGWCWRTMPARDTEEKRLSQIVEWARNWQAVGVPVACFQPVLGGDVDDKSIGPSECRRYLLRLPDDPTRCWLVEPFLSGRADYSTNPDPIRLTDSMGHLARMHKAGQSGQETARNTARPAGLVGRCQRWQHVLSNWRATVARLPSISPSLREIAVPFARLVEASGMELMNQAAASSRMLVPAIPCVRDIWHDHLLFTSNQLTGLVDLHSSEIDSVDSDLTRLLGSLHPFEAERWSWALAEYEQVRPLSPQERQLLHSYERSSVLLSGCHWLDIWSRRGECDIHVGPELLARERSRFEQLLERLIRPSPVPEV